MKQEMQVVYKRSEKCIDFCEDGNGKGLITNMDDEKLDLVKKVFESLVAINHQIETALSKNYLNTKL